MALLRLLLCASLVLSLVFHVLARPSLRDFSEDPIRPLVIWHGMGDSYGSPGILQFISLIKDMHPGLFVHSVYLNENIEDDQKAGFFGDVNEQILQVSEQLANITELQVGFDAIGFSQGGQFLRAYVERYNVPPVHNLITFGSQHMGISDLPVCGRWDVTCQLARRAAQRGVYTEWAQEHLVQAQYFRDPAHLERYLAANTFLPSINNEIPALANSTYAAHLASLHTLVLVLFSADRTVVPKETGWFGSWAASEGRGAQGERTIVPMRQQPLYTEDWIGLRTLDERGGVVLATCEGEHMQLTNECWQPLVVKYVGGPVERDGFHGPRGALVVQ
ncbi:alpha/beta-hydrolase [Amylocystis lapponica]|nr:alpha/beta-hydrolase [Amylocystis lapponica]